MKKLHLTLVAMILVFACVFASACIPKDYADAESALKEKDYSVTVMTKDGLISGTAFAAVKAAIDMKGSINAIVSASKKDGDDTISGTIYYLSDKDDAKAWADYNKEQLAANKKKAKSSYDDGDITESQYKSLKKQYDNTVIRVSGSNVFIGHKKVYSEM